MGEQHRSTKYRGKYPQFTTRERKMYEQNIVGATPSRYQELVDTRFNPIDRPRGHQFGGGFGRVCMKERGNLLTRKPNNSSKTAE